MDQTPVHEQHNPDLLAMIPGSASRLLEVGCSSGALARECRARGNIETYVGVEIDPAYAELARRHCDECLELDIEHADDAFWNDYSDRDCWVFGDTLEHLQDPWKVLRKIRSVIPPDGTVVACIPNAQHWSIQVRLALGQFRYEDQGLLDRTHLRWFTRQTIIELFAQTGFTIEAAMPRIFEEPARDRYLPMISGIVTAAGGDAAAAVKDALPLQYVLRARPT